VSRLYGHAHRRLREEWRPRVERGEVCCCYGNCGLIILPGEPWDLAHDPFDSRRWMGPAHARCNRNSVLERRIHGSGSGGYRWSSDRW